MEKTTNYQLPKWEKSDFIKMDDFNDAFGKLDAALKANADAAAGAASAESVAAVQQSVAALEQTVAKSKLCRIKYGSYVGDGKNGSANPTAVNCGFYPVLFGIWYSGNNIQFAMRGGSGLYHNVLGQNNVTNWQDNGLSWYCDRAEYGYQPNAIQYNEANMTYRYILFGYDQ